MSESHESETAAELRDWNVYIVMTAGSQVRKFTMTVPAPDREHATKAAEGIAVAVSKGSGGDLRVGWIDGVEEVAN